MHLVPVEHGVTQRVAIQEDSEPMQVQRSDDRHARGGGSPGKEALISMSTNSIRLRPMTSIIPEPFGFNNGEVIAMPRASRLILTT